MDGTWAALGAAGVLSAGALVRRRGQRNVDAAAELESVARGTRWDFRKHYPDSARGTVELYLGEVLQGEGAVRWPGSRGELVPVDARYAYPISGNIFDGEKLGAVAGEVGARSWRNPVVLRPGYGLFGVVDRQDIQESIQYAGDELGQPYTTGDEELDAYLAQPDDYTRAEARAFELRLRRAEREGAGDFGALTVQVRDGNHRTFGAILGGEDPVWVRIMDNQRHRLVEDRESRGVQELYRAIRAAQKAHGAPPLSRPRRPRVRITPELAAMEQRKSAITARREELARQLLREFEPFNRSYRHRSLEERLERPELFLSLVYKDAAKSLGRERLRARLEAHPAERERAALLQESLALTEPLYEARKRAGLDPMTGEPRRRW